MKKYPGKAFLTITINLFIVTYCFSLSINAHRFKTSEKLPYTNAFVGIQAGLKKDAVQETALEQFNDYLRSKPIKFEENKGQIVDGNFRPVPFVLFKAEAPGMSLYITEKGLTYVFVKHQEKQDEKPSTPALTSFAERLKANMAWVHVFLDGANISRENIIKEVESSEHYNYFYGHCQQGIYDVHQYHKITIKEVYPGIDWVFYNSQTSGMKYDFVVHPGADPSQIKLIYEGENPLTLYYKNLITTWLL